MPRKRTERSIGAYLRGPGDGIIARYGNAARSDNVRLPTRMYEAWDGQYLDGMLELLDPTRGRASDVGLERIEAHVLTLGPDGKGAKMQRFPDLEQAGAAFEAAGAEQASSRPEVPDPPPELVALVGGDMEMGRGQVQQLRNLGRLRPDDHVLDVGCGIGRTAIPLTEVLCEAGAYEGFDVSRATIDWCSREITSRYPNFRFRHVDLFNRAYNPAGAMTAAEFTFPYDNEQFDLVFLYSVFTHLLPEGLERYLAELSRVIRKGGRMLATFFFLHEASLRELSAAVEVDEEAAHVAKSLLEHDHGEWSTGSRLAPEWMVAYTEPYVRRLLRGNGLVVDQWAYGRWLDWATGRGPMGVQDTVVAHRAPQHLRRKPPRP